MEKNRPLNITTVWSNVEMWTQGVRSCLRFFPHWTSVEGREARITLNKEDWAEILFKKISHIFQQKHQRNTAFTWKLPENYFIGLSSKTSKYCSILPLSEPKSKRKRANSNFRIYEAGMQLGISPGLRNTFKNCRWKPNCIPASPSPTALQTIFFEVQIHSASFSTKIKKRKRKQREWRYK